MDKSIKANLLQFARQYLIGYNFRLSTLKLKCNQSKEVVRYYNSSDRPDYITLRDLQTMRGIQ